MRGRAFVDPAMLHEGATVTLDAGESHYLVRVRRAGAGDPIELLDGVAARHHATVVRADAKACVVQVGAAAPTCQAPLRVVMMGLVDARAVAEAVAGASEAAATELIPVRCARAQGTWPSVDRIAKLVRASQRQCGRAVPLSIGATMAWGDILRCHAALPGWVATPDAPSSPGPCPGGGARVLVGPEGGLTPDEVSGARRGGFSPLRLGPFVQRTPTAIVSALARLSAS